jgi:DNA-binding transcriptional ArsR family regulator
MPFDREPVPRAAAAVVVTPSAASELGLLICNCSSPRPAPVDIPAAVVNRSNRFWADGGPGFAELVVLAHATGTLDDPDIEALLERLRDPVVFPTPYPLETEPADERDLIHARLTRLASDKRLRTRYVSLLGDLWAAFASTWAEHGRAQVEAAAARWAARLAAGEDAVDLLPDHHIARDEAYAAMVRRAQRDGTLRMNPVVAGRGHIVALPGALSVAAAATVRDAAVTRRRTADEIADRLRALSEPTRLTILAQLAHAPSGVSDLARTLHIAQPTASVHLRQLKDAGLVTAQRSGTRNVYATVPGAVEELLAEVGDKLTQSMA